ncbi:MAG: PorT family protein [Proteobacteria bacterium]|nr:PorT family protein [Pseudomonadota bacterium]
MFRLSHTAFWIYCFCLLVPETALGQSPLFQDFAALSESNNVSSQIEHGQSPSSQNSEEPANTAAPSTDPGAPAKVPQSPNSPSRTQELGTNRSSHFAAGGKIGVNIATFGGPDADRDEIESTFSPGFAINAFARFAFIERWSIQSEISYTTRGARYVVDGERRSPFDLSYIEFAIAPHVRWPLSRIYKRLAIDSYIGPAVGYLLSAQRAGKELTGFKSIDFGIQGGVGLYLSLPFGALLADVRYFFGIPDIDETPLNIKNRAFSILLGYETPLPFDW